MHTMICGIIVDGVNEGPECIKSRTPADDRCLQAVYGYNLLVSNR